MLWLAMLAIAGPAELEDITATEFAAVTVQLVLFGACLGALAFAVGAATGCKALTLGISAGVAVLAYLANGVFPQIQGLEWTRDLSPWHWYLGGEPLKNGLQTSDALLLLAVTDKSGRTSAGILLWRRRDGRLEVLLAHQGGPYWVNKDLGHWTIPKGEVEGGEELVAVARREFAEETGHELPDTSLIELGEIRQKSGKLVLAWAARGDLDAATAVSNTYETEWPPGSGRVEAFPEIDRVEWFKLNKARRKLKAAQVPFLDRLQSSIAAHR
jgi:predicted NUDIX family NTP pyrophosphohydrolase